MAPIPNPQSAIRNPQSPILTTRLLQLLLATAAVVLIAAGGSLEYKVYDDPKQQYGLRSYSIIGAYDLAEDATFSGTIRIGDELFSTYNRAAPKGKMACPT